MRSTRKGKGGSASYEVSGGEGASRALRQLSARLRGQIVADVLYPAAEFLADRLRANAPVDTGLLRQSVHVVQHASTATHFVVLVQIGEGDFKGSAFYAAIVEYGSERMEARHYAKRTFLENEAAARSLMISRMSSIISTDLRSTA